MKSSKNKSILQSVQNGLLILKVFSKEKPILGITEISNTLNLPKSTVSRLINELVHEGYIQKEGRKYRLGLGILCLSGVIMSHMDIHRDAFEPLKSLVNKIEETAHISILERNNLIYLLKVESKQAVRLLSHVGHIRPPTCSSPGKVLLAYQPKEILNEILSSELPKRGPNSVTDPHQLLEELSFIRKNGYAICINEMSDDVVSIAAPIKDYTGKVIAAVSVAGTRQRIDDESIESIKKEIIKTGKEISHHLGYMESLFK